MMKASWSFELLKWKKHLTQIIASLWNTVWQSFEKYDNTATWQTGQFVSAFVTDESLNLDNEISQWYLQSLGCLWGKWGKMKSTYMVMTQTHHVVYHLRTFQSICLTKSSVPNTHLWQLTNAASTIFIILSSSSPQFKKVI